MTEPVGKLVATLKMLYCPNCGRYQEPEIVNGDFKISYCCAESAKVGNPIVQRFYSGDYSDMIP